MREGERARTDLFYGWARARNCIKLVLIYARERERERFWNFREKYIIGARGDMIDMFART